MHALVIVPAEIDIISADVVGHEVKQQFQPLFVGPTYKIPEFIHPPLRPKGPIRVHIIIVIYGIRRTGLSLDYGGMGRSASCRVAFCGMADDPSVPDVIAAQGLNIVQTRPVNVRKMSAAIL